MTTIQHRRGTAAAWTASNRVLAAGEFGYETDTGEWKAGDGSTAWADLAYLPSAVDVAALFADKVDAADLDTLTATEIQTDGSETKAALSASYAPGIDQSPLPLEWRGVGRSADQDRTAGFYVRGINLGLGPNTIDTTQVWGASWDWAGHIKPNLDRVISLGANTTRVQGSYAAYAADPTTFKTRYQQVMDYCRDNGIKVLYAFLNALDDTLASANRAAYNTMIVDLATPYAGADFLLGWDIGNELGLDAVPDLVTLATNFRADLLAVDPDTKITCSIAGTTTGLRLAGITAADPVVDFHDLHIYTIPQPIYGWSYNWLDQIKALTDKPFMIGEWGGNMNGSGGGLPNTPTEPLQANYVASMLRFAGDPDCMGFMVWAIQDDNADFKFGLYDAAGNPRRALAEFTKFPDRRTIGAVASALLAGRATPVVVENFARADAAPVGAPPLGPAPVEQAGTWSIDDKHGLRVTSGPSVHTILTWDGRTADGVVEAEAVINNGGFNSGLVFRYVDASNYWVAQFKLDGVRLYKQVAGAFTLVDSKLSEYLQYMIQPKVILDGDDVFVYDRDRLMCSATDAAHNTATAHGIYEYPADEAGPTWWFKFSIQVPLRAL